MDWLITLSYLSICVVIFRVFGIPFNRWTVPSAIVGGAILVGSLTLLINYTHPYSDSSKQYFVTIPIVPVVQGTVLSVDITANTHINKGDILFRIDPLPYQNKVAQLTAKIVIAKQQYLSARELSKEELSKDELSKPELSEQKSKTENVDNQEDIDITKATIDGLNAQLNEATYNLRNTIVRAHSDGYVTQISVFPGLRVVPIPLNPAMLFIQESSFKYVSWYPQNKILQIKAGYRAELVFDALPGKVFAAEVTKVLPNIADGEMKANASLLDLTSPHVGKVPVVFEIKDLNFEQYRDLLPLGAYGQSAVYSEEFEELTIIRKVLLRMSSWASYVLPIH
ncbi:HlyD family secretion protein [Psychromonas sp. SR45-3]|uniref:HlyD family secretion protein n=1 Tax=Psychromonas sp. SR45-3 TaxID=2760930 RepID=UPI0015FE0A51|nr:biotin/lipoyl-binding protein [Psychromonas sp. SR45-3]MBB1272186.1 HlyD family secretion protein [Psychromonas sp. SR45-3]